MSGTPERDDMERKEIECFDSGRTDCADHPGAYLDDPDNYPPPSHEAVPGGY